MIEDTSKKFSPSKLSTYKTCPKQYFYHYIERIPSKTQSVESHLGNSVHEALEELYEGVRNSKILSLEEVLAVYEKVWARGLKEKPIVIRDGRFVLEDWRKVGRICIENYYKEHQPFKDGKVVGVELRMGFPLKDADPELGTEETYRIEGLLDRLMLAEDGFFEIHDYKTSKTLPTQADQDEDWQLAVYAIAVLESWPDAKGIRLKWHFLRHGKTIVSARAPERLAALRGEILSLIRKIKHDQIFEPVKSALCDWCDYRDICPLWKHAGIVAQLPDKAKPYESGVKLVDAYAELESRKKKLKEEIAVIDEEQEKLRERVIDYANTNGMSALEGTSAQLEVHPHAAWRFPTKTHAPKDLQAVESALKATAIWPQVSRLDGPALMDGFKARRWPSEIIRLIQGWLDKYIHIETATTVRLRKKKETEDD